MIPSVFWRRLASALWLAATLAVVLPSRAPAADAAVVDFGPAILETWVQPAYPDAARKAKQTGEVLVNFVVEADGSVTRAEVAESSAPMFDEAALAAVRQWRFKPAIEDAKPAASAMAVPVVFLLQQLKQKSAPIMPPEELLPRPLPITPARAENGLDPDYPYELEALRLPGVVRIRFTVDPTGRALRPQVLFASHPAFVETALRTLERTSFVPAHQGPLARSDTMEYPVSFQSFGAKPGDVLDANRLERVDPMDSPPLPVMIVQPVYPYEELLAGKTAKVAAEFTVDVEGQTGQIVMSGEADPAFRDALRAAIENWVFQPVKDGAGAPVRLRVTHEFSPNFAEERLVGLLKPGAAGIAGPAGLDAKLTPLWRGYPVYPKSFTDERPSGQALIEFVIDRDGRARLPRIVEATAPEFGWAATAAVSQWVFERPRRGGEPVDVLVKIPIQFVPPRS